MNSYITGGIIRSLREENEMTQSVLAEKIGVSAKAVSKWETGKGYPDITLIEPIANVLGVSVTELLSGETVKNKNRGFNMNRTVFYVCPVCGNIITTSGEALICCHGITLPPLEAETPDKSHEIKIDTVEDEYYITLDHPMTKSHYISFFAALSDNGISVEKLYPEGAAEARFKIRSTSAIYGFCNRHGLFSVKIPRDESRARAEEARRRWQNTAAYKEYEEKTKGDKENTISENGLLWIFQKFGKIKSEVPDSEKAQALVFELQDFITKNYYACTDEILLSLADMYVSDERFRTTIDNEGGTGTAEFVCKAIKSKK